MDTEKKTSQQILQDYLNSAATVEQLHAQYNAEVEKMEIARGAVLEDDFLVEILSTTGVNTGSKIVSIDSNCCFVFTDPVDIPFIWGLPDGNE